MKIITEMILCKGIETATGELFRSFLSYDLEPAHQL